MGNEMAFPQIRGPIPIKAKIQYGLTKREYFAAIAMQGLVTEEVTMSWCPASHAQRAVMCADALITELNKEKKE
jgi:hypothetical protein